jgi:hypothetical protein
MNIIYKNRGMGKTTRLMYLSEYMQIPIIVGDEKRKQWLIDTAQRFDIDMPEPMSLFEWQSTKPNPEKILIDDAEYILQRLFSGSYIEAFTMSNEKENKDVSK